MARRVEADFNPDEQEDIDAAVERAKKILKEWPFTGDGNGQIMSATTRGRRVFVTMENGKPVKKTVEYEM